MQVETKLDNPVWFSLSETHHQFAVDYPNIKFYLPEYCPFGGFERNQSISKGILDYSALADDFFIVGEEPELPQNLRVKNELVCLQMAIEERVDTDSSETIIELNFEHEDRLYQLVNLVQPGYFRKKTSMLGSYFGIFKEGKLVSVSGERMKMNDFVEISAIVTHPDHTGNGYARQLIAKTVNNIIDQAKTPYLHVVESNTRAIRLYEKLGFYARRKISFWHITQ